MDSWALIAAVRGIRIVAYNTYNRRKRGNNAKEEEEASPSHFERLPSEVALKVLSQLKCKTLMASIPQVGKLWRALCHGIQNVHLDFSWWKEKDRWEILVGRES